VVDSQRAVGERHEKKEMRAPMTILLPLILLVLLFFSCFTTLGSMRMEQGGSGERQKKFTEEKVIRKTRFQYDDEEKEERR
jgi:hypothetical protein